MRQAFNLIKAYSFVTPNVFSLMMASGKSKLKYSFRIQSDAAHTISMFLYTAWLYSKEYKAALNVCVSCHRQQCKLSYTLNIDHMQLLLATETFSHNQRTQNVRVYLESCFCLPDEDVSFIIFLFAVFGLLQILNHDLILAKYLNNLINLLLTLVNGFFSKCFST